MIKYEIRKNNDRKYHNRFILSTLDEELAQCILKKVGKKYYLKEIEYDTHLGRDN